MKKKLILFFAFISVFTFIKGQKNFYFDFRTGINAGAPIGPVKEGDEGIIQVAQYYGLAFNWEIHSKYNLQAELLVSSKKGRYKANVGGDTLVPIYISGLGEVLFPASYSGKVKGKFNNIYLDMPITFNYGFSKIMYLQAGVYSSFLLRGSHTGESDIIIGDNFRRDKDVFDDSEYLNPFDFGFVLGGQLSVHDGFIKIGFRGTYGINSVFKKSYPNVKDKFHNFYMAPYLSVRIFNP